MSDYISKERAKDLIVRHFRQAAANLVLAMEAEPPADVKPVLKAENLVDESVDCDQFICAKCGIRLKNWSCVEVDDYGDESAYEYAFNFCPNCGADTQERITE